MARLLCRVVHTQGMIQRLVRLLPGVDLRLALEALVQPQDQPADFVIAGIGSLADVRLRLAAADEELLLAGPHEIELHGWRLSRQHDGITGYKELVVARDVPGSGGAA
jgi:predicted DNA-binding protein with PD1-like motif